MKKTEQEKFYTLKTKEKLLEKCKETYASPSLFTVTLCLAFFALLVITAIFSIGWMMDFIGIKTLVVALPIFIFNLGITFALSLKMINTFDDPQKTLKIIDFISDNVEFKNSILRLLFENLPIKKEQISMVENLLDIYPQLENKVEFFQKKITEESFINILAEAKIILNKEIKQLENEIIPKGPEYSDLKEAENSFYINMDKKGLTKKNNESKKDEENDSAEKIYKALFLISTSENNKIRNIDKRYKEVSRKIEDSELSLTQDVIVKALYKEVKKDIASLADTIENDQLGFDQEIIKKRLDQINAIFTGINKTLKSQKEVD